MAFGNIQAGRQGRGRLFADTLVLVLQGFQQHGHCLLGLRSQIAQRREDIAANTGRRMQISASFCMLRTPG